LPQFPPALLEQIKSLVPISRLVGEYVQADKAKSTPGDLWATCPAHGERTPSFHAEDARGIFHCFGCGVNGDHFGFLTDIQGKSFPEAVQTVADLAGVTLPGKRVEATARKPAPKYEAPALSDPYGGYEFIPVPEGTPDILPNTRSPALRNPKRAGTDKFTTHYKPSQVHPYHNAAGQLLGYVLLVEFKDGKITPGIWWARGPDGFEGWCHGSIENAPLYGLPELLAHPDKQVLVVEGEKCRRAADKALGGRVVIVSWCGGTNRVDRTDWTPLAGRSVIWWADDDDEGRKAMETARGLAGAAKNKRVTEYRQQEAGEYKKGGDVADLIADGGSVADYIKANISEIKETDDGRSDDNDVRSNGSMRGDGDAGALRAASDEHAKAEAAPDREADRVEVEHHKPPLTIEHRNQKGPLDLSWEEQLKFTKDGAGLDKTSIHNCQLILEYHEDFKGLFAYNSFSKEIMVMRRPPWERSTWKGPRAIIDSDAVHCIAMMENIGWGGLKPKRSDMEAVIFSVAEFFQFNPILDAMETLVWDGLPRLQGGKVGQRTFAPFGVRYMGVEPMEINRIFFTKALVGLVARVYDPGCKLDTTLILEGGQGVFKSTAIKALADGLVEGVFTDEIADPGSKDAGLQMQGKWIIEFSEMASLKRSDIDTTKGWLSRQTDRFRPPFGRSVKEYPRVCGFVGSTNPPASGYFRDPTGARRFWPVRVGEVDLALIKEDARQIWAEARDLYKAGHQWWLNKEEEAMAEIVQAARYEADPWSMMIDDYLARHTDPLKPEVKVLDLMGDMCLRIHNERRTPLVNSRIEAHLNMIGWRKVERGTYRRPTVN